MISRVLIAVINYDHPQNGLLGAFREIFGANISSYDFMERSRRGIAVERINTEFVAQAKAFRPDWVWLQLQDSKIISAESISKIRVLLPDAIVTHWTGDCRPTVSPYLSSICRATHGTFISSVGQIPMFQATGARHVSYLQIGVDQDEDVMGLPKWTPPFKVPDVVFCGGYYGGKVFPGTADRESAIRALQAARIDVGVVGPGWPAWAPVVGKCTVKQQHHVYRKAKVALSVNHFNNIELYYSDRQLIAMASGTPVVCRYVPGLEREFIDGVHCVFYRSNDELVTKVQSLITDGSRRTAIGLEGRNEIIRNHTWKARIVASKSTIEAMAPKV